MTNIVQAVQAAVQGIVRSQSRAACGLCRVCGTSPYVTREDETTTAKNKPPRAYMDACTPCTPCTGHERHRLAFFHTLHARTHTLHNHNFI